MKYWVYMNGEIPGSYEPEELAGLPGFQETAMVCPADGSVEDRNWRRAGQFPDILEVLQQRRLRTPPAVPFALRAEPGPARSPDDVLNDVSTKIFSHVTELMKELENRREEHALTQSLQRQLIELKNDVQALRERNQYLQERVELLPGFQKRENKLEEKIHQLEADAQRREDDFAQLDSKAKQLRIDLSKALSSEKGLSEDLIRQSRLNDELNMTLADKELQLARAFAIISKLEAMLGDIVPGATAGMKTISAAERGDDVDIVETARTEALAPAAPEPTAGPPAEPAQRIEPEAQDAEPAAPTEPEASGPDDAGAEPAPEPVRLEAEPRPSDETFEPSPGEVDPTYTSDTEMSGHQPDWPEEGEVTPVPPPWKVRLGKAIDSVKKRFSGQPADLPAQASDPAPTDDSEPPAHA